MLVYLSHHVDYFKGTIPCIVTFDNILRILPGSAKVPFAHKDVLKISLSRVECCSERQNFFPHSLSLLKYRLPFAEFDFGPSFFVLNFWVSLSHGGVP